MAEVSLNTTEVSLNTTGMPTDAKYRCQGAWCASLPSGGSVNPRRGA